MRLTVTCWSSWGSWHIWNRSAPLRWSYSQYLTSPSPPGQGSWRRTSWTCRPGWCPVSRGCPRTSPWRWGCSRRWQSVTDGSWEMLINIQKQNEPVMNHPEAVVTSLLNWVKEVTPLVPEGDIVEENFLKDATSKLKAPKMCRTHLKWVVGVEISKVETRQEEFSILMSWFGLDLE